MVKLVEYSTVNKNVHYRLSKFELSHFKKILYMKLKIYSKPTTTVRLEEYSTVKKNID